MTKFKGIGEGLLSNISKELKLADDAPLIHLDINLIDPNEKNQGLSLDGIEELAQSILENGLDQNLVVVPIENRRYKILSGHRRRLALLYLIQQGHSEFRYPLVMVKDTSKVKLNISENGKEKYAMLTTNLQRRKNTVSDNLHLMQQANEIFDELQTNGGNVGKRREWVAEQLGLSASSIKNLKYIDENIAPEFREEIEKENLLLTVATKIAHMPPEEQKKLHTQTKDSTVLSVEDVKAFQTKEDKTSHVIAAYPYTIDENHYDSINQAIKNQVNQIKGAVVLSKEDYTQFLSAQRRIQKQLKRMNSLITKATK